MPNLKEHLEMKQHYIMNNSLYFLLKPPQKLKPCDLI